MTVVYILLALLALVVLYVIAIYNKLVKRRNQVEEGWSGIDVQLKRRANLIPNLVETVKGYAAHETNVLEEVTSLRNQSISADTVAQQGHTEGLLGAAIGRLFAVAEAYPDLKADASFQQLHGQLSELEDQIQMARRYYNGTVRDLNTLIESFPSNFVAGSFSFTQAEFFELDNEADRAVPKVSFQGTS
jgi:LemA protein